MGKKAKALPLGWWWPDNQSPGVRVYLREHEWFDPGSIRTDFPYHGFAWSEKFSSEPGHGWTLHRDHISNNLTADLIAAAERLSPRLAIERNPGMPGGMWPGGQQCGFRCSTVGW